MDFRFFIPIYPSLPPSGCWLSFICQFQIDLKYMHNILPTLLGLQWYANVLVLATTSFIFSNFFYNLQLLAYNSSIKITCTKITITFYFVE